MSKKFFITFLFFFIILLSFYSFAFAENNSMKNAKNDMMNAGKNIGNALSSGVNNLANGVKQLGNDTVNGVRNIGDDTADAIGGLMDNNDGNYTATRTATGDNNLLGMSDSTWTWLILGITGLAIAGLVWYYGSQYEHRNYNND